VTNDRNRRQLRIFDLLEHSIERIVEGSVGRVLPSKVQPAEIARRLEREMTIQQVVSVSGPIAPNAFVVHLHPHDAADFEGYEQQLTSDLEVWLEDLAGQRDLRCVGPIRVEFESDARIPRRGMRITAAMIEDHSERDAGTPHDEPDVEYALLLSTGRLRSRRIALREGYTIVGRAPASDLVLDDPSVSRFHARLEVRGRRIDVRDLDSTNGTRLNGYPVNYAPVEAGDTITFGGIEATVELNSAKSDR
jgi:Protein of unknown function (DUF3662)/FHA domain